MRVGGSSPAHSLKWLEAAWAAGSGPPQRRSKRSTTTAVSPGLVRNGHGGLEGEAEFEQQPVMGHEARCSEEDARSPAHRSPAEPRGSSQEGRLL